MKMSKKVREFKSGDFIFAKVKGYPAWPARVQRPNGKKYFVYFYGTGETANLPPNMIFDYAENKDKFLTKTVKRRDFNDGVKQIEHDFANNIPLEQVVGLAVEPAEGENNTINESANETADESMGDTTVADETITEENTTQNDTGIEDSDETGALVIDEGKTPAQKGKKTAAKTPAKETPKAKEPKTPRSSRQKKEDEEVKEDDKKEEEIVSRSGRKIRPKRYIDEQTEDNSTLPSPAPKKRRGASPVIEKEKEKPEPVKDKTEKNIKHFNAVPQFELEDLKQPFTPEDAEKDNIIITYLPSGQYIGVRLFQSRPSSFKNDNARLQWDRQAAANALTLKTQLEKGQITPQSIQEQLVMDLNLTEEEKATLDKGRETDEKKSRVQFLKSEMKLIELDTKIKTCLCLEKADTELCLKLLDELTELDLKPLMLLKHPSCVETIKRMRAYVGNTPSWDLSTDDALVFSQRAKKIRDSADKLYQHMKELFTTPEGLSFWEFFSERVSQFKKVTAKLTSDELLELIHEPLEMSVPTSHTMKSSIETSNEENQEEEAVKKKNTPAKSKKTNGTPSKAPVKRQSSRRLQEDKDKEVVEENEKETEEGKEKTPDKENDIEEEDQEVNDDDKEQESNDKGAVEEKEKEKTPDKDSEEKELNNSKESNQEKEEANDKEDKSKEKSDSKDKKESKDKKDSKDRKDSKDKSESKDKKESKEKNDSKDKKESKDTKVSKDRNDKDKKKEKEDEKQKNEDEPRAKRSRESKKTEPPPRSPTKRKSKVT